MRRTRSSRARSIARQASAERKCRSLSATIERQFVKGLGRHSFGTGAKSRLDLLRAYRRELKARTEWGDLDHEETRARVDAAIKAEKAT